MSESGPRLMAHPLPAGARAVLCRALERAGLPIDDVEEPGRLFWQFETEDQVPVGYGGLEVHGRDALVRSVVTLPPARHRGIGAKIVAALETEALMAGCSHAWAITASAVPFFERLGYSVCERSQVPETIASTRQFRSLCPETARVLVKELC